MGGRKLMGSAQSRKRDFVLQHGSLPLTGDISRLVDLLAISDVSLELLRNELNSRACTLEFALGGAMTIPAFDSIAYTLSEGFAAELNLTFPHVQSQPTEAELALAHQLVREQYGKDSWTFSK